MDLGNAQFVDKRIEAAAAEESRFEADFVLKADDALDALLKQFPERSSRLGYRSTPFEICDLHASITKAANLAWALRRFPVFDTSCLKRMRMEKGLKVLQRNQWGPTPETVYELDLWLPALGFSTLGLHDGSVPSVAWMPTSHDYMGHQLDEAVRNENRREIETKAKNASITLQTKCPPVPGGITRKLEKLSHRFERTSIVWEAQWSAFQEVKDPLILGHIGNTVFLLDQFDASKLERYVMGEFCRRPQQ